MSAWHDLRHLLRGRWFRRLFSVRVVSQLGDGVFQVALASYVIFSPEQAATPGRIATALAAVLLPFSVLGPFVGVFLDRWSRRQVLVWSNAVRVPLALALGLLVLLDVPSVLFFATVLACLSVNRFLLAGLSAALPHVTTREELITANALTPTAGTFAFLLGLAAGTGLHEVAGLGLPGGIDADAAVLVAAGLVYAAAAGLALRMPRDLLGPDFDPDLPAARRAVRHVATGLVDGLRHLSHRPDAARGLSAIGAHRFCYGISTVSLILLYRNYFHDPAEAATSDAAFRGLAFAVLVAGAGFVTAAVITPPVTQRTGPHGWVRLLLVVAAAVQVFPGLLFTVPGVLVASYLLGVASQGIKICVDTLVQTHVDDAFRGRVFSLYDVLFNVTFVAAAAVAAAVLPTTGRSPVVVLALAVGYLVTALWYGRGRPGRASD